MIQSFEHENNSLKQNIQLEIDKLTGLNLLEINKFCEQDNPQPILDLDLLSDKFLPKRKGNLTLVSDPEILQGIAESTIKTLKLALSETDEITNLETFTRYWTFLGVDKRKFYVTEHYPVAEDTYDVVQAYISKTIPAEYKHLLNEKVKATPKYRKIMHGLIQG